MSLIEFEKWFLDRMYGEHKMSAELYDEISDKITSIKTTEESQSDY